MCQAAPGHGVDAPCRMSSSGSSPCPISDAPLGHLDTGQADGFGPRKSCLDGIDRVERMNEAGDFLHRVDHRFPAVWSPCKGVRLCLRPDYHQDASVR